jgi:hypothetical protein
MHTMADIFTVAGAAVATAAGPAARAWAFRRW